MARIQINKKTDGDYGYICFSPDGREAECYASSQWNAIKLAREYFKVAKSKQHLVTAVVAERPDGTTVAHTPDF